MKQENHKNAYRGTYCSDKRFINFKYVSKLVSKYVDLYSAVIVKKLQRAECTSIERTITF